MKHEYEAKFVHIDADDLKTKLKAKGAELTKPGHFQYRAIYENERTLQDGSWVRLRQEGKIATLALKRVTDAKNIAGTKETEMKIDDFRAAESFLEGVGLRRVRYQENHREEWFLDGVAYDFDTWPGMPTLLEIEGESETAVKAACETLGLEYDHAKFGSVDTIYLDELNRDILKEPELLFSEEEKRRLG